MLPHSTLVTAIGKEQRCHLLPHLRLPFDLILSNDAAVISLRTLPPVSQSKECVVPSCRMHDIELCSAMVVCMEVHLESSRTVFRTSGNCAASPLIVPTRMWRKEPVFLGLIIFPQRATVELVAGVLPVANTRCLGHQGASGALLPRTSSVSPCSDIVSFSMTLSSSPGAQRRGNAPGQY